MGNNKITITLPITVILDVATKRRSEMTSYLNNGYDFMNYFAKFEKFLRHSIIMRSFMTAGSQMSELDRGPFLPPPPYNLSSRNTPYKLTRVKFSLTLRAPRGGGGGGDRKRPLLGFSSVVFTRGMILKRNFD